jgi:hypothetical protein
MSQSSGFIFNDNMIERGRGEREGEKDRERERERERGSFCP